jgi:hypothetical protein
MPVTVLYPEERQIPDDDLEREIFGPEVRILRRRHHAGHVLGSTARASSCWHLQRLCNRGWQGLSRRHERHQEGGLLLK